MMRRGWNTGVGEQEEQEEEQKQEEQKQEEEEEEEGHLNTLTSIEWANRTGGI